MRVQPILIDMEALGAEFAVMDSTDQAKFFRGLARELKTWKSDYQKQLQFAHVASEITPADKGELENALGMLWLKDSTE
jgi:F0F1-type ATP synthase alpha subunit